MQMSKLPKNFTDTELVTFNTVKELGDIITSGNYSGGIFRNNYTKNDNFIKTSIFILDYDNAPDSPQLTLDDAIAKFKDYCVIIATTRNHRRAKTSGTRTLPAVDRFRVILVLSEDIVTINDFYATFNTLNKQFPGADEACKDPARRLFASLEVRYINETGARFVPTRAVSKSPPSTKAPITLGIGERGLLARSTTEFLKIGAPAGSWNPSLYKAARDYLEQGYSKDEFITSAEKITGFLDSADLSTIRSAYSKPAKYGPRLPDELTERSAVATYVRTWLLDHKVNIEYKTGLMLINSKATDPVNLLNLIYEDSMAWAERNPIMMSNGKTLKRVPYSYRDIEINVSLWLNEEQEKIIPAYRDLIEYNPDAVDEGNRALDSFITAIKGSPSRIDSAVLKHFIWQVKRKLNQLPVDWHLMPIFSGQSGSGKTRAITELLRPLNELSYFAPSMSVLDDTREATVFTKFFVIFMDEMAKAERVNVEAMKNKITSETISYRKLGTNIACTVRNNATFIAATNSDVQDLIYDPKSARRFWQIVTARKCDWSIINELNYLSMWQCVNERAPSTISEYLEDVLKIQDDELRVKSPVELWLDDYRVTFKPKLVHDAATTNEPLSATFLYNEFITWAKEQEFKHYPTRNQFGRNLSGLGIEKVKRETGWFYHVEPLVKSNASVVPFKK